MKLNVIFAVEWTIQPAEKELEKTQAWPGIEPVDNWMQRFIQCAYQANWIASYCEFVIYLMVEMTWKINAVIARYLEGNGLTSYTHSFLNNYT